MTKKHKTPVIFAGMSQDVQERTLKFHQAFYDSTGNYKDEIAYKLCKCTNLPLQSTRASVYIHSVEASHYPLIECSKCHVLMEREDSHEHAKANCDPVKEGQIFLTAMKKYESD